MIQAKCQEELTICKKPRLAYNNSNQIDFNLDSKNINLLSSNSKIIVHSSSNCEVDLNGGDSGFQELNNYSTEMDKVWPSAFSQEACKSTVENTSEDKVQENKDESIAGFLQPSQTKENTQEDNLSDSDSSYDSYWSDMSEESWQPGPIDYWISSQMTLGKDPKTLLSTMLPNMVIPSNVDPLILWKILLHLLNQPPQRPKITHINLFEDVINLIKKSSKIIVLTGAGVSVSCGIPDFRSRDGVYARLSKDFPDLPNPQAIFDIKYFKHDQKPFFKFAKEIYPGQFEPSISHKFIKCIEDHGKLLRNYSQNIDTLEIAAGIERVVTCHGSFATATCTRCKFKTSGSSIKESIFSQRIPHCPQCPSDCEEIAVIKPDIVFFGESLPDEFHDSLAADKDNCDLLIVMGSSLRVQPVALIPNSVPQEVPQILINREPLDLNFDVELLGDCDVIVQEICNRLGGDWSKICVNEKLEQKDLPSLDLLFSSIASSSSHSTKFSSSSNSSPTSSSSSLSSSSSSTSESSLSSPSSSAFHSSGSHANTIADNINALSPNSSSNQISQLQAPILLSNLAPSAAAVASEQELEQEPSILPKILDEQEINNNSNLDSAISQSEGENKEDKHQLNQLKFEDLENLINGHEVELNSHKNEGSSIFNQLDENCFYYFPPSRHIFKGAEVYEEELKSYANKLSKNILKFEN